jgi:hypothetical protein
VLHLDVDDDALDRAIDVLTRLLEFEPGVSAARSVAAEEA